jgi:addiction module RelE/StbE family toxin
LARELIILPRFKRDFRIARGHPEFDIETLEYVFDVMISGGKLPDALREHRLDKRSVNWAGLTECHLGADLLLIYRVRRESPNRNSQRTVCANQEEDSAQGPEKAPKAAEAKMRPCELELSLFRMLWDHPLFVLNSSSNTISKRFLIQTAAVGLSRKQDQEWSRSLKHEPRLASVRVRVKRDPFVHKWLL